MWLTIAAVLGTGFFLTLPVPLCLHTDSLFFDFVFVFVFVFVSPPKDSRNAALPLPPPQYPPTPSPAANQHPNPGPPRTNTPYAPRSPPHPPPLPARPPVPLQPARLALGKRLRRQLRCHESTRDLAGLGGAPGARQGGVGEACAAGGCAGEGRRGRGVWEEGVVGG